MKHTGLLIVFISLLGKAYGQNVDPRGEGHYMDYSTVKMSESPTASAFNTVGDIQVNPAKGIPDITIPLFTYEVDGVKVPISISYAASGIKVSQMATSVGLGWSLNAGGQISRTVRSKPDEDENGGWYDDGYIRPEYYSDKDPNNINWQEQMKGNGAQRYKNSLVKKRDHNPDMFSYSFLGHSGTYVHDTVGKIIKDQRDGIYLLEYKIAEQELEAYDLEGNYYFFDNTDTEKSSNKNEFHTFIDLVLDFCEWENDGLPITTAWKLSNITTKNGKEIQFKYESVDMEYTVANENFHLTIGRTCSTSQSEEIRSRAATNVTYRYSTQLLTEISSPDSDLKVEFQYAQDTGLPDSVWKKKLVKITVINIPTNNKREFHFDYDRFSGDPRLKLKSVREVAYKDGNATYKPPHKFEYQAGNLPPKDSKGQDLYGYYNGKDNNKNLVPDFMQVESTFQSHFDKYSGDRSLDVNGLKRGVLTKITYPTGGKTLFDYDPNVESLSPLSGYRGGLRIKEVKNMDEYNDVFNRKTYHYNDLKGIDLKTGIYDWFSKSEGRSRSFFGHPNRLPGDHQSGYKTGYFYGEVTVVSHNGPSSENFKIQFKYTQNHHNLQRYDYALESQTIFRGVSPDILKIVEYENEIISPTGNAEVLEWYIVGDMDCFQVPSPFDSYIGHTVNPRMVQFSGNYAYLPTRIATTEFLKNGSSYKPVTTLQEISYHPETLLKTKEITDLRHKRVEDLNENVTFPLNDPNAERIVVDYTYPFDLDSTNSDLPLNFPEGIVLKQEVHTAKAGQTTQTGGQAYAFDNFGNIKTIYKFNKGEGGNNSGLSYVPSHYEERTSILYGNGKPVEVKDHHGVATTYIWSKKGDFPLAKIEGVSRASINGSTILAVENANYNNLPAALNALRSDAAVKKGMVTTFTHKPLAGVETTTDPKGETSTYEYDEFGRLILVRDDDGNIMSETEYNYAGN